MVVDFADHVDIADIQGCFSLIVNSSRVKVSTLCRFITNAEKSRGVSGTGYSLKDKNKATNDKTKHRMEDREKDKVKSKPKSKKVKVNQSQSQPRDTALERASKTEPELMGQNFIGQAESKAKIEDLGGQEFLRARMMFGLLSLNKHNKHKQ
ncbi:hypothetical protein Tco_0714374 [Tanacetum coccineum]